jgi:mono/diheme cytochrome c family protein
LLIEQIPYMRTNLLVFVVLLVALNSCNDPEPVSTVGNELPGTFFTIYPGMDTVLKTPGGALLTIPAGALDAGDANRVVLEIKEAYTAEDMTRGRLIDHSNGEAFSSVGMIYLNVAPGQSVSIHKPLEVSMPAKMLQKDLMVYKGLVDEGGSFWWADARPLAENPGLQQLEAGKALFQSTCASCHGLRGEAAGPPLAWITRRRDPQWLHAFTRNNATLLWRGDAYSCYLFNRYKTSMPSFRNLSDADLATLYRYIDNASQAIDSNSVYDGKRGFDSCVRNDPNCGSVAARANRLTAQGPVDTGAMARTVAAGSAGSPDKADYYRFTIDKHGWYAVARKGGPAGGGATASGTADASNAAGPGSANRAATSDSVRQVVARVEPLQACPCWCDESAYRKADSVGRAKAVGGY